jgi:hypothetical protein
MKDGIYYGKGEDGNSEPKETDTGFGWPEIANDYVLSYRTAYVK